jgi:ABC-2 type transport system permease protein
LPSSELIQRFQASKNFRHIRFAASPGELGDLINRQEVIAGIHLQSDFSRRFYSGQPPTLQVILDGRKSNAAQIVEGYIESIVDQYNSEQQSAAAAGREPTVQLVIRNWFNPNLDYLWFTVPSLAYGNHRSLYTDNNDVAVSQKSSLVKFTLPWLSTPTRTLF